LETAVNVSRIGIKYSVTEVLKSLNAQKNIIIKTGGEKEREAYFFLKEFLEKIDTPGDKGI
jgi:hypothetical protein